MPLPAPHFVNARLASLRATRVRRIAPAERNPLIYRAAAVARKLQSQNQYYAEVKLEAV